MKAVEATFLLMSLCVYFCMCVYIYIAHLHIHVCASALICAYVHIHVCMWRPQNNLNCHPSGVIDLGFLNRGLSLA